MDVRAGLQHPRAGRRTGLLNDDAGAVSSNGQQNTLFGQGGTDLFFLSGLDQHDAIEEEEFVGI